MIKNVKTIRVHSFKILIRLKQRYFILNVLIEIIGSRKIILSFKIGHFFIIFVLKYLFIYFYFLFFNLLNSSNNIQVISFICNAF